MRGETAERGAPGRAGKAAASGEGDGVLEALRFHEVAHELAGDPCVAWDHARRGIQRRDERQALFADRRCLGGRILVFLAIFVAAPVAVPADVHVTRTARPVSPWQSHASK